MKKQSFKRMKRGTIFLKKGCKMVKVDHCSAVRFDSKDKPSAGLYAMLDGSFQVVGSCKFKTTGLAGCLVKATFN